MKPGEASDRYLLGHGEDEWRRLAEQHRVWRSTLLEVVDTLGVGGGARILEVGCGGGDLLADLARVAGPGGRAVGVEVDPSAAARAEARVADLPGAEVRRDDVLSLELGERFDLVVARWVLSFLRQPRRALERMVAHVEPGGLVLVQDYDYDSIRVEPGDPAIDRLFQLMPEAYVLRGGDAWLATRLPRLYAELGLELMTVEPRCLAGAPGSPVFGWVESFFRQHAWTLVEDGLLSAEEHARSLDAWTAVQQVPGTVFFSPLVVAVAGRRPAD